MAVLICAMILESMSVLMGSATSVLSQIIARSQLVGVISLNKMLKVSTGKGNSCLLTCTRTISLSALYAEGLVTSNCFVMMMVHSSDPGMVSNPYLPGGICVPPIITESPKVSVVAWFAPVLHTFPYGTKSPKTFLLFTPGLE